MYYNGFKPNRVPYKRAVAPWARKTEVAPDAAVVAKVRAMHPAAEESIRKFPPRTFVTGVVSATYPMHKAAPAENPFNAPVRVGAHGLTLDAPKAHAFLNEQVDALCDRIAENHAAFAARVNIESGAALALKHAESVPGLCGCNYWACPDCRGDR